MIIDSKGKLFEERRCKKMSKCKIGLDLDTKKGQKQIEEIQKMHINQKNNMGRNTEVVA